MKNTILIAFILLVFLAGGFVGYKINTPDTIIKNQTDTIIKIRVDTLRVSEIKTVTKWRVKTDTTYLRVLDTLRVFDTIRVQIPIYKYKTRLKGDYVVFHHGYNSVIDSITAPQQMIIKEIHYKPKRWGVGLYTGVGLDKNFNLSPQIGIGVTYSFIEW